MVAFSTITWPFPDRPSISISFVETLVPATQHHFRLRDDIIFQQSIPTHLRRRAEVDECAGKSGHCLLPLFAQALQRRLSATALYIKEPAAFYRAYLCPA